MTGPIHTNGVCVYRNSNKKKKTVSLISGVDRYNPMTPVFNLLRSAPTRPKLAGHFNEPLIFPFAERTDGRPTSAPARDVFSRGRSRDGGWVTGDWWRGAGNGGLAPQWSANCTRSNRRWKCADSVLGDPDGRVCPCGFVRAVRRRGRPGERHRKICPRTNSKFSAPEKLPVSAARSWVVRRRANFGGVSSDRRSSYRAWPDEHGIFRSRLRRYLVGVSKRSGPGPAVVSARRPLAEICQFEFFLPFSRSAFCSRPRCGFRQLTTRVGFKILHFCFVYIMLFHR